MKGNGRTASSRARANLDQKNVIVNVKATGMRENSMVLVGWNYQIKNNMKGTLKMVISKTNLVNTHERKISISTSDHLRMTNLMVWGSYSTKMGIYTWETSQMEVKMDLGISTQRRKRNTIKGNGRMIRCMARVSTLSRMAISMKVSLKTENAMGKENIS